MRSSSSMTTILYGLGFTFRGPGVRSQQITVLQPANTDDRLPAVYHSPPCRRQVFWNRTVACRQHNGSTPDESGSKFLPIAGRSLKALKPALQSACRLIAKARFRNAPGRRPDNSYNWEISASGRQILSENWQLPCWFSLKFGRLQLGGRHNLQATRCILDAAKTLLKFPEKVEILFAIGRCLLIMPVVRIPVGRISKSCGGYQAACGLQCRFEGTSTGDR